jgi:hypothetical protein
MKTSNIEAYKHGSFYEIYMHRAFGSYDTSKPGMHGSVIKNLYTIEGGDTSFKKYHGSFEKQLEQAKKYMHKAMDKYLKMKKNPIENIEKLYVLESHIDLALSTDQLMSIIYEVIELTDSVK